MEATYRSQMSTSVFIPNRFDTKQKNPPNTYRTDAPLEIPPSPTLTNPDMILPDDGERQSSTPSPPFQLSPSDPHMLQSDLQSTGGNGYYHSNASTAHSVGTAATPNRPPRSRWTYESHAHGRPLSDIGEEDYQPSPPAFGARYTSERYNGKSDSDSGSTISASSQQQLDSNTGGSGGHGTDLDLKRSSFTSQSSIERARAQASDALVSGPSQPSEEDSSSAILSSEAERILENAKRRLTLMEGNLTRARSSIRLTQTPSPSPSSSGHLLPTRNLQPAGELYRSISQTDRRGSLLRPRPVYTTQESGHSRGHSETNIPSAENLKPPALQPSRSMSALGSTSALQYETRERFFPYNAAESNGYTQATSGFNQQPQDFYQDDEIRRTSYHSSDVNGSAGLGISTSTAMPKMSSMEDFNSAYPPDEPPSRAQSQLQVRDLKDQAAGLRTKVALLKVKTQEDNLRRRSLQSLRTPSPFTATDRWYSSELEHGNGTASLNSNTGYGWIPEAVARQESNGHSASDGTDEGTIEAPAESQAREVIPEASQPFDEEFTFETDDISILESQYEDAEEGAYDEPDIDRDALNEILDEPYDDDDDDDDTSDVFEDFPSGAAPEATPHEEREDAFDYENFYLHSALGTFSRSKMRRRSYDSTGSNETTRPLQDQRAGRHSRSGSGDSISTFATFATATENAYDDDQDDALHAIDQIVDGWDGADDEEDDDDAEDASTPVQSRRTTVISRVDDSRHLTAALRDDSPLTPTRSLLGTGTGRDLSTPTTPVDAFMRTLSRSTSSRPPSSLKADDTRLLEQVFESLGKVCTELQELTMAAAAAAASFSDTGETRSNDTTPTGNPKHIRTLRRRLDAARRVLDGQLDSDA